jgi:hypothetical protein
MLRIASGMKIIPKNWGKEKVIPTIRAVTSIIKIINVHFVDESSFKSSLLAATTAAVRKNIATTIPSKLLMKSIRMAKLVAKLRLSMNTR